jgi:hypothetical protein
VRAVKPGWLALTQVPWLPLKSGKGSVSRRRGLQPGGTRVRWNWGNDCEDYDTRMARRCLDVWCALLSAWLECRCEQSGVGQRMGRNVDVHYFCGMDSLIKINSRDGYFHLCGPFAFQTCSGLTKAYFSLDTAAGPLDSDLVFDPPSPVSTSPSFAKI